MEPAFSPPSGARILFSAKQIQARVRDVASEINRDYAGRSLFLVGVLKGSFIFMADLVRHLQLPIRLDFMGTRSYSNKSSSGEVQLTKDIEAPVAGEHVLLVEDIVDTGLTLHYLLAQLQARQPASLRTAAFLDKPARHAGLEELKPDYCCFQVPRQFVIGYGLDDEQQYRQLPDLWVLE